MIEVRRYGSGNRPSPPERPGALVVSDMPLKPQISSGIFLHVPHDLDYSGSDSRYRDLRIIVFITGNPGLVEYYHTFLSLLADSEEGRGCVIYGASLGGFELDAKLEVNQEDVVADVENLLYPTVTGGRRGAKMWGLREQVELCMSRVDELVRRLRKDDVIAGTGEGHGETETLANEQDKREDKRKVEVILIGHSVGAWITLEMIRYLRYRRRRGPVSGTDFENTTGWYAGTKGGEGNEYEHLPELKWEVEAAILLTPTIMDLPLSNSGRIAGPVLGNVPYLPEVAQWGAAGIKWLIGEQWLRWVLGSVTGMQEDEGNELETTVRFLLSDSGVKQSLFLARDELSAIRGDAWGDDVWRVLDEERMGVVERGRETVTGTQDRGSQSPRLHFLFAEKDRWVADETRQKILERWQKGGRHRFVVDESGLQHAWCLRQNKEVVVRVRKWLGEIIEIKT